MDELAELLLDATADASRWGSVLSAVAGHLDATCAALLPLDEQCPFPTHVRGITALWPLRWSGSLADELKPKDPVLVRVVRRGSGQSWPKGVSEWLQAIGWTDAAPFALGVGRAPGTHFSDTDLENMRRIAAMVFRATTTSIRVRGLAARERLWSETLDSLKIGIFILSPDGDVIRLNRAAEALLKGSNGIEMKAGRLALADRGRALEFGTLVSRTAADGQSRQVSSAARPNGQKGLFLNLRRLDGDAPPKGEMPRACVAVYVSETHGDYRDFEDLFRSAFKLTRMEARTAAEMMRGNGIDEVARSLGVGRETIRSHVKSVFLKTGARRQAELVHRMLGSAIALSA